MIGYNDREGAAWDDVVKETERQNMQKSDIIRNLHFAPSAEESYWRFIGAI